MYVLQGNVGTKHFGQEARDVITKKDREVAAAAAAAAPPTTEEATFAGGCFWGVQLAFQRVPGVTHTEVRLSPCLSSPLLLCAQPLILRASSRTVGLACVMT